MNQTAAFRSRSRDFFTPGTVWFIMLMSSICLEGLGRKFLPSLPSIAFYFAKDFVLIGGMMFFGLRRRAVLRATRLYGAYIWVAVVAFAWTGIQLFNPGQESLALGIIGLRAYWLWWLAPVVVASSMTRDGDFERALTIVAVFAMIVAVVAAIQFNFPAEHWINVNASYEGEVMRRTDVVGSTMRARVSSTFSFISGFTGFSVLGIMLLFSFGLGTENARVRFISLVGAGMLAVAVPTSGGRGPVVLALGLTLLIAFFAGMFMTKTGRRLMVAISITVGFALFAMPDAVQGVRDRFAYHDTQDRVFKALLFLPPIAITEQEHLTFGAGTGMMQNARFSLGIRSPSNAEAEGPRILVEQGTFGYLIIWLARVGLAYAILKMGLRLRRLRRRAAAGGAVGLAILTLYMNQIFDHVFQALFFTFTGLILHAVLTQEARLANEKQQNDRT